MKWKGILLLACAAISVATYSKRADRQEEQRALERAAERLEMQEMEKRFFETTGASKSWLHGTGCGNRRTPLYVTQRAIQQTGKAVFNVRLDDVVLINDQLQLRANYRSVGECLFAPDISVHAWISDEQAKSTTIRDANRLGVYLLAIDITQTYPQDRGVLVTGQLIDIAPRSPRSHK